MQNPARGTEGINRKLGCARLLQCKVRRRLAVNEKMSHAFVMRRILAGMFVLSFADGSSALPDADVVLVPGTVAEVEGCFVYTESAYDGADEKLVAFGFTCNAQDLNDRDWIYMNGMGIGVGDCVQFGASDYCVEWITVGEAAGLSRRNVIHRT